VWIVAVPQGAWVLTPTPTETALGPAHAIDTAKAASKMTTMARAVFGLWQAARIGFLPSGFAGPSRTNFGDGNGPHLDSDRGARGIHDDGRRSGGRGIRG